MSDSTASSRRIVGVALFAQCYFVVAYVSFGLPELMRLRLELEITGLPWHVGAFLGCGICATVWAERKLARGLDARGLLNLLGWCGGIQAALALLSLGIHSSIDVAALAPVLGITLGIASALIPASLGRIVAPKGRAYVLGPAIGCALLLAHVAPITFVRPERLIGMTALVSALAGWYVWTRRYDAVTDPEATDRDLINMTAANAAAALAALAAALFQYTALHPAIRESLWSSPLVLLALGGAQLVLCWVGAHLMRRRFNTALAAACLVSAAAMLWSGEGHIDGSSLVYNALYAGGTAALLILVVHRLSERAPRFAVLWICWIAIPIGTIVGMSAYDFLR